jgi:hypothetical protein
MAMNEELGGIADGCRFSRKGKRFMQYETIGRRSFLKTVGAAGMLSALPEAAFGLHGGGGHIAHEVAASGADEDAKPKHSIKFAVIGLDHAHIMGITAAVIRGGGELAAFYSTLLRESAGFQKIYPHARLAKSEDEILDDPSIQLVASASIPNLRAPLGIRVMKHGKDYLSDKPAITTLEQLSEVRKVSAATRRMFAIMYSERLEVRAASPGERPQPSRLVLGPGAVRRHSVRHRIAPGGPVCLLHRLDDGCGHGVADRECESSDPSGVSGLRRHDAPGQRRRGIRAGGLVYPGWTGHVG